MKIKYRIEIILIFLCTQIVSVLYVVLNFDKLNDGTKIVMSNILISAGFLYEIITLKERPVNHARDTGLVSSLFISAVILAIAYSRYLNSPLVMPEQFRDNLYAGGIVIFLLAFLIRILSKKELKTNFSYSIQISENHKLIKTGVYSIVRHPAYLGTYLFILSVTLLFGVYVGFLLIIFGIPITLNRMNKEEKLLIGHFGKEYLDYQRNVKKIIPYIF